MRYDLFERFKTHKGWTQSKLAQEVGITAKSVMAWKKRGYSNVYIKKKMINYMTGQKIDTKNVEKHWFQCEKCFQFDSVIYERDFYVCRECNDEGAVREEK